jgi:lysozyme
LAGHPTAGCGHLLKPGESFPDGVTEEQVIGLLRANVGSAEHPVGQYVKVPLAQGQIDALVSFTYNLGSGSSTQLRPLNQKQYERAAEQFLVEDRLGGIAVDGLKRC